MSNKVYWGYFRAGGNMCVLALLTIVFISGQISTSGTDYWVTYWTNSEVLRIAAKLNTSVYNNTDHRDDIQQPGFQWLDEFGLIRSDVAIYVYTFCIFGCIFLVTLRSLLFMKVSMNASRNIHNSMFANLLRATMRFFNTNPSGLMINFSAFESCSRFISGLIFVILTQDEF